MYEEQIYYPLEQIYYPFLVVGYIIGWLRELH